MNRLQPLVFIVLLWMGNAYGQVEQEVNTLLKTKDFVAFKAFTDTLQSRANHISCHWTILRDLAGDFREGVFSFEKSVPDANNEAVSTIYSFSVNVLVTETTIVYYELAAIKNKRSGDGWVPYRDPIDSFRDDQALEELNKAFKAIFRADLDEKELFSTNLVYGESCGFAGGKPEGRRQINALVKGKNKVELVKWLQSGNTEKQVYAVDGLYQLTKLGVKLTAEELQMIHYVKKKNGNLSVCSGCIHHHEDILSATEKFTF